MLHASKGCRPLLPPHLLLQVLAELHGAAWLVLLMLLVFGWPAAADLHLLLLLRHRSPCDPPRDTSDEQRALADAETRCLLNRQQQGTKTALVRAAANGYRLLSG